MRRQKKRHRQKASSRLKLKAHTPSVQTPPTTTTTRNRSPGASKLAHSTPDHQNLFPFTTHRAAIADGLKLALSAPGFVLFASAIGFGALAKDVGMSLGHATFLTTVLYAMPAQVLFADQVAKDASVWAAALAISLTGVRLLPMTLSILPLLSDEKPARLKRVLAVHFVAVTAWFEGLRRLPHVPPHLRLSHFVGLGASMLIATLIGTLAGYFISGRVPTPVAATLLLTTPVYFFVSLLMSARLRSDWVAIALGALLGPPVYLLAPGFDLMIAGLLGGTIAFLVGRKSKITEPPTTIASSGPGKRS